MRFEFVENVFSITATSNPTVPQKINDVHSSVPFSKFKANILITLSTS